MPPVQQWHDRVRIDALFGCGGPGGIFTSMTTTTQTDPTGFFTLEQRAGRWWLLTPQRQPFFSLGLNHIDPATMRYPENIERWRDRYGSSTIRWIEESVAPHLRQWGFNTVGWVQEATVGQWQHSRSFTPYEYRALGMPYFHLLPFTKSHQWEANVRHYDYDSSEWETWCDHVARSQVVDLCDDPNLIGYFYSDCPTWVHDAKPNKWRGPIFDSDLLASASGRKELRRPATRYYETTHDAVRRYDPHHLILGDRYEANAALPMEVIDAALPLVDVLSFQDFVDPVSHLREWYEKTERPVLLADAAHLEWHRKPTYARNDGHRYVRTLADLRQNPGCIGFHLCGAFQRNRTRRWGLLDENEQPDVENVAAIRDANRETLEWVTGTSQQAGT